MTDITFGPQGVTYAGKLITWADLDYVKNQYKFADYVLVTLSFGYGRNEWFQSFIHHKEKWAEFKEMLKGQTVYLFDFAGKHSEVDLKLWDGLEVKETTDLDTIINYNIANGLGNGNVDILGPALDMAVDEGICDHLGNKL